jgi:hypothetical protein
MCMQAGMLVFHGKSVVMVHTVVQRCRLPSALLVPGCCTVVSQLLGVGVAGVYNRDASTCHTGVPTCRRH